MTSGSRLSEGVPMRSQGVLECRRRVLFAGVENGSCSQMAEAFARIHGGGRFEPHSAGSRPSGKIDPRAIAFMREVGYDLSRHTSKSLDDIPAGEYEAAITVGRGDACPLVRAWWKEDWQIPDPDGLPDEDYRRVRDLIERKVRALLAQLE
jgi:protein-tyrosine-phosphatase